MIMRTMSSVKALLMAGLCLSFVTPTISFAAEEEAEWKRLEKAIIAKRNELKKLRTANPAHIWGEEKQPVATRKRMMTSTEKKYYVKQVVDVRPWCVCKHAPLKNGGTKAKHSKNAIPASYDQSSCDSGCSPNEVCPQWKDWDAARIRVEETEKMNKEIDPVIQELEELERRFKEHLEERDRERKAAAKEKAAARAAKQKKNTSGGKTKK